MKIDFRPQMYMYTYKIALFIFGHILLFTLPVCIVKLVSSHYYYHYYFVVFHATIPMVNKDTYKKRYFRGYCTKVHQFFTRCSCIIAGVNAIAFRFTMSSQRLEGG